MPVLPTSIAARILVVDDEAPLHRMLRDLLEYIGADVQVSETGEDAVRKWDDALRSGTPFDVVITDIGLGPGLDGIGVAKHIRSSHSSARIVACTGSSADPVVVSPAAYGFDGCIAKPFLIQDLLKLVEALVR